MVEMFSSRTGITIAFSLCPPPPTPLPPSQHTVKKSSNLSDWHIWVHTAPIIHMLNLWVRLKCSAVEPTLQSLLAFVLPLLLPRPLLSTLVQKECCQIGLISKDSLFVGLVWTPSGKDK